MGRFNLSHDHTLTGNMGKLIPIGCLEVLPGDVFRMQTSVMIRTAPLLAPVMHPVYIRIHHFFVPNRIVDPDWEDFITTTDGRDATNPTVTLSTGSLADHFGLEVVNGDDIVAHPVRAYNMIWNEWYRDQDLQSAISQDQQTLQDVAWGRDYFTKARPSAQQGTAVPIPITGASTVPLQGIRFDNTDRGGGTGVSSKYTGPGGGDAETYPPDNGSLLRALYGDETASEGPYVNIDGTGSVDVNQFRAALYKQQLSEERQRYGSRYEDLQRSFGVRPQDSRLQRPELLAGASRPVRFSEVVATAEGTNVEPGDLYGHGLGMCTHRPWRRMFPEHGFVLTLMSVLPRTQYMNMVPRQFLRVNPTDYWFPEGEIEGPQPIATREVYAQAATPGDIWGYTGRHDEYRSVFSYVSGEMRSALNTYNYARDFSSEPALNGTFIAADPTDRVYSDTATDQLRIFASHRVASRRPVSQAPMV